MADTGERSGKFTRLGCGNLDGIFHLLELEDGISARTNQN